MSPDAEGAQLVEDAHRFMRGMEQSSTVTIAAVNSIAFGGGCELAMACDFRIAAESATFGQPEINLGIIPGFGGTQRLPRLVGEAKALEMNLTGDPIDAYEAHRVGLANQVVPDHELFDTALSWARKLSEQAPIAIEQIKKRSAQPDLDEGLRPRARASRARSAPRTRRRASPPSSTKRRPKFKGQVRVGAPASTAAAERVAELLRDSERAVVLTGAGISVPSGIPDFRSPGTGLWENVDPMEVAHIDAWRRDPDRFWSFYGAALRLARRQAAERRARRDRRARAARPRPGRDHPEHRPAAPRSPGTERLIEVHGSIDQSVCLAVRREGVARPRGGAARRERRRARVRGVHRAAQARRRPVRRAAAGAGALRGAVARARGRPDAVRGLLARGLPGGRAAGDDARRRRPARARSPRARRRTTATPRSSSTATWSTELQAVLAAL